MYLFQYIDDIDDDDDNETHEINKEKEINDTLDKMSPLEMLIYWFIHADEKDDTFDYIKK